MKKPNNKAKKRLYDIPQLKPIDMELDNFHVIYNTTYHGVDTDKVKVCEFGCLEHVSATQLYHLLPPAMGDFKNFHGEARYAKDRQTTITSLASGNISRLVMI